MSLFTSYETLPQEVMFLLAEEDEHIRKFRGRVEKEKGRITKDVDMVRDEMVNLFENLKIQMHQ
jgi:F-box/WD-40 domain protein 7